MKYGIPIAATLALATAAPAQVEVERLARLAPAALKRIDPCLVTIQVYGGTRVNTPVAKKKPAEGKEKNQKGKPPRRPRRRPFPIARGATSGVIISPDGLIITSLWSFQLAPTTIVVELRDGRKLMARALGRDFSRGLALLQVEAGDLPLPEPAPPATIRPGRLVLATGRTFGPELPASSMGILSAVGRLGGRAVQTDADVSPSCYGGALIDLEGRIIGVLAPLSPRGFAAGIQWYDSGIGFAATWAGIEEILPRLRRGEEIHPGRAGIALDPSHLGPGAVIAAPSLPGRLPPGTPQPQAVTGPAKKAGLKAKDRILEMDGVKIRHSFHLENLLAACYAGDQVALTVKRGEKLLSVKLTLEKRSMAAPLPKLPFPVKVPGQR